MADLARRATRWVGTCHTGMCMSNFMMIGWEMAEILHIEISRKHVSVTYDLDLWPKLLKIFVSHGVPIRNMYAKFHNDRLRNGWDITLWNFAKTRTNTDKHTHTQTHKQTDMGITIPRPPPMGGEVINPCDVCSAMTCRYFFFSGTPCIKIMVLMSVINFIIHHHRSYLLLNVIKS